MSNSNSATGGGYVVHVPNPYNKDTVPLSFGQLNDLVDQHYQEEKKPLPMDDPDVQNIMTSLTSQDASTDDKQ